MWEKGYVKGLWSLGREEAFPYLTKQGPTLPNPPNPHLPTLFHHRTQEKGDLCLDPQTAGKKELGGL